MNTFARRDNGEHEEIYQSPDILIVCTSKFNEYGLIIHDGGESSIQINYCPWYCQRLPVSKRDSWFEELENIGIEDFSEDHIPKKFKTDDW